MRYRIICLFFFLCMILPAQERLYLDELDLGQMKQGSGKAQKNLSARKTPLLIEKKAYSRGIGTQAPSELRIELGGKALKFSSAIGIDDSAGDSASLVFAVYADGKQVYSSSIISRRNKLNGSLKRLELDMRGVQELALVVDDANNGRSHDYANWAEAYLELAGAEPKPRAIEPAGYNADINAEMARYKRFQYGDELNWKAIEGIPDFKNPPVLEANESFDFWSQTAYLEGIAYIPILFHKGTEKQESGLIGWNPASGMSERIRLGKTRVSAFSSDPVKKKLLIGSGKTLLEFDPLSKKISSERAFFQTVSGELLLSARKLIVRKDADFHIFDADSLAHIKTIKTELDRIQRMIAYDQDRIVLASTYWGATLRFLNLESGAVSDSMQASSSFHYHSFLRGALMQNGLIGIFDVSEKYSFGAIKPYKKVWFSAGPDTQVLAEDAGIRHSPRRFIIEATVRVKATQDMEKTETYLSLMPQNVYNHELRNETFIPGSRITHDQLGNRYLILGIPAIKKGESHVITAYSATLSIYRLVLDIDRFGQDQVVPEELKLYLEDDPWYDYNNPIVAAKHREVVGSLTNVPKIIRAVHNYAKTVELGDTIVPAPEVIQLNTGACNNHTRVQIALLRRSGIPARFAWNFFGPAEGPIEGNHWICEAWIAGLGWIPMEGQRWTFSGGPGEIGTAHLMQRVGHTDVRGYKEQLKPERPWTEDSGGETSFEWKARAPGAKSP